MGRVYRTTGKGTGLVSIIIAMMALLFIVMSGFAFYNVLAGLTGKVENRITAIGLTISQLEDLSARDYTTDPSLSAGSHTQPTNTIAADVPTGFGITYDVTELTTRPDGFQSSMCKTIVVTCSYPGGKQIQLTKYMIP